MSKYFKNNYAQCSTEQCATMTSSDVLFGITMSNKKYWLQTLWHAHYIYGLCVRLFQGKQKQFNFSGFGSISFSQGKIKFNFYKKQVTNKSASMIFGFVMVIIFSYNRYKKYIKRYQIISCSCIMLTRCRIIGNF